MNTRKLLPLLVIALAMLPSAASADPIGLDPGSPAYRTVTPLPLDSPDNPLHLTTSQQYHINARKLKFQKDATVIYADPKINHVNKGIKIKALEKDAARDILAMLDAGQQARVNAEESVAATQNHAPAGQSKAMQALKGKFIATRDALLKTITPAQRSQLLELEQASRAKVQAALGDKTLSNTEKSAKLQALYATYEHQRDSIYTPSQRAEIRQISIIMQQAQAEARVEGMK